MDNIFYENTNDTPSHEPVMDIPKIDPKNPFENFTEYEGYNSDYREIIPQIDIPGCEIPFEPASFEKKKIRHYFNVVGGGILLHFLAVQVIFTVLYMILQRIVIRSDGIEESEITTQYLSGVQDFFNNSSITIGLNMLIMMLCSLTLFFVGSKVTKIKLGSYFQTKDLGFKTIVSYCIMSFFIRYVGGIVSVIFEMIFNGVDMSVGTEMMSYNHPKTIIVTVVYTCFVAPVIEELMYRGFVLKNLSRVSQRFGIIISALLFGLMHGNVSQFLFAFCLGIFLAHIDIKHNSLLPSIIVHAVSNIISIAVSYSGVLNNYFAAAATGFFMVGMGIAGVVFFVKFYKKNRLPFTMPHQKLRNGTAVSSVLLIMAAALYIVITIINSFPSIAESIVSAFK